MRVVMVMLLLLVPGTAVAGVGAKPGDADARSGAMVEAGLGAGTAWFDGDASVKGVGFSVGTGTWVRPNVTLGVLASGVRLEHDGEQFVSVVLGPSVQYWPIDHAWLGGGVGVGLTAFSFDDGTEGSREPCLALRLRAGVMLQSWDEHSLGISAEVAPLKTGLYDTTTALVLLNYEYL